MEIKWGDKITIDGKEYIVQLFRQGSYDGYPEVNPKKEGHKMFSEVRRFAAHDIEKGMKIYFKEWFYFEPIRRNARKK